MGDYEAPMDQAAVATYQGTKLTREPPRIFRLEDSVVNRIAAGEVIQRPVSAVKELIENSLDAGSTTINVVVKDGGLKLIQVSDDGHGIRYEDLPILCERHTTSKLSTFEDLQNMTTMGFRGEALASMTFVAHVTVTTITTGELHGYRVCYRDGVMEHPPKPCAAVRGTQIMIENLFYNMTARRKTFENSADEYAKIVDLLSRFAIHHISVSISCRKHGAAKADVHSIISSSRIDAIRSVYGTSIAQNLINIEATSIDSSGLVFEMEGLISNSNYVSKKMTMILFINDRLVDCNALKRSVEVVYAAVFPKASKPFVYMSIKLPPDNVDVNIHPTKKEVSLLHQEIIVQSIQSVVASKLKCSNNERSFQEHVVNPLISSPLKLTNCLTSSPPSTGPPQSQELPVVKTVGTKPQKAPVKEIVRTDSSDPAGRLHAYLPCNYGTQSEARMTNVRSLVKKRRNSKEVAELTSIQQLLCDIDKSCHSGLLDLVKNCTFVGMVDDIFMLIQYNTSLYLADVVTLSKELMYQQVLRRFAHFNAVELSERAPVQGLIMLALKEEDNDPFGTNDDALKEKISQMNTQLLIIKAEMLEEYFSIYIDADGNLCRLPIILDQYTPEMDRIPELMLALGNDVDWDDEKNCFQSVAAAIGNFYAMHPPLLPNPSTHLEFYKERTPANDAAGDEEMATEIDQQLLQEAENSWAQREWSIQHVLLPSMRLFLKPPSSMATNGAFVKIASLDRLYKIFERC